MRTIEVSTDVFAEIWKRRVEPEANEDQILRRLFFENASIAPTSAAGSQRPSEARKNGRIRWVDDIYAALEKLGGVAHLSQIYLQTRKIRANAGRSIPDTFEEVVRKELETHSSDSEAYLGRENYFMMAEGKGAGIWSLR